MIKLVSWNVNSVRVRLPHLIELNKTVNPDIIMLQETKSTDENFPFDEIKSLGFEIITVGQKSYNGVAILSKEPIELISNNLPGNKKDEQARFLEVRVNTDKPFNIGSVYLPNGNPIDTEKFPYKLDWMKRLKSYAKKKLITLKHLSLVVILTLSHPLKMQLTLKNGETMLFIILTQ